MIYQTKLLASGGWLRDTTAAKRAGQVDMIGILARDVLHPNNHH